MSDNGKAAESSTGEMCAESIERLIHGQIVGTYDAIRMQTAWEKILDGSTPPKVMARALVRVLSHGRYELREEPKAQVINIYVSGSGDPDKLATELSQAIRSIP